METQTCFWILAALLLAERNVVSSAEENPAYFKVGGELELDPMFSKTIKNILWKISGDLLAEWFSGDADITYYGKFKGRTTLNKINGKLLLKNMAKEDEALFTVEINHEVQSVSFRGKAIVELQTPKVLKQPAACSRKTHETCQLYCYVNTTNAGPVTYKWKEGNGNWNEGGDKLPISKSDSAHVEEFSCQVANPVSEKESKAFPNLFYEPWNPILLIVCLVVALIVIVIIIIIKLKWKELMRWFSKKSATTDSDKRNSSDATTPTEGVLLKSNP